MPSETDNQSQRLTPDTSVRPERPLSANIQNGMTEGDSILDFVAKNSPGYNSEVGSANGEIQQDVNVMAAARDQDSPKPDSAVVSPDVVTDQSPEEPTPAPEVEPEVEPSPEPAAEPTEGEFDLKGSSAENFKKIRMKLKETSEESVKKDKLLANVTKELEKYAKGEKMPEELVRREERIAELEHYERLLNLKKSRYYQDSFVKPLADIKAKLDKAASDYGIDPTKLIQAANLTNEADLNRFLANNFDSVGANEIKAVVREYKGLQEQAVSAEKEPAEALSNMIQSAAAIRQTQQVERLEVMQDVSRNAWRESLDYIKDEGKIRELMYKEGDLEHNTKVFTPIVQAAATEYGKLVNQLAKNGLENLPKPLAYALSRLCQLAHASAVAISSRERAVVLAEQLETNTQRTQKHIRPSVSGSMGAGKQGTNGAGAGGGPSSTMEAAENLLQQIRGN